MEIQLSITAITPTKCLVISGSTLEAIPIQLQASTLWVQTTLFVYKYKLLSTVKHILHPWTERVQERCPCSKTKTFTFARNLQLLTRINQSFMVRCNKHWACNKRYKYVWRSEGEAFEPKNTVPGKKRGDSIMLWGCFATSGTGNCTKWVEQWRWRTSKFYNYT